MSRVQQSTVRRRDPFAQVLVEPQAGGPPADDAKVSKRVAPRFWQSLSTFAVVGTLAGLAWWGHSMDWKPPKFSDLLGAGAATGEAWCKEHNVPEGTCIECQAGLAPLSTDFGWCKTHGITQCPFEHPEVAQLKSIPVISPAELEQAERALALRPRAENSSRCKLYQRRIQFASIEALDKAGVDIALAIKRPIVESITATGEVIYDQTHTAHLASRVSGSVAQVLSQVGDQVRRGDVLALVDAADVGKAKSELLQAITQYRLRKVNLDRLRPLVEQGSIPERQFREAEAASNETEIRLLAAQQSLVNLGLPVVVDDLIELEATKIAQEIQFLGLPQALVASFDPTATTSNLFPLRAPLEGTIVERDFVPGEVVDTSKLLLSISDTRQMWLTLDVRQDEAKYLRLGQTVLFRTNDNSLDGEIEGQIAWISTAADDQTRTIKIRANLPNADGQLRANTFGVGRIVLRKEPQAIVVPSEAIHSEGDCNIVFVRDKHFLEADAAKFFHVRQVRIGVRDEDTTEVIAGLLPGEVVASKNSVVLAAQLLRSNLGAGCGCVGPHKD